jgi:hypothetical protein
LDSEPTDDTLSEAQITEGIKKGVAQALEALGIDEDAIELLKARKAVKNAEKTQNGRKRRTPSSQAAD